MKRKERELINQIDYEENKIAKKILRRYKFEKWIYYTIFLLLTITCILWAINIYGTSNLLLCLVIYIIFSSFFATRYRQHSEKLIKEALNTSICPEGFLNINIYNAKKMLVNKSAYNYTLNKIATGYIQLGEFEKAKGIIKDVEKIKNNIIIKGEIIKNKIDIAFFTENKKEFKEQCEKMRNIIKFLPKKSRKEITFNMTIKEAIMDKDVKKVNELSQQLEKRKNLLDKIMVQYYKGVVLEKNNKNYKNEYKFVAEKGNNLYIAKQAREKLKIEPKDNPYKKKRHVIYKAINIISILIILLYMMSVLIYMKEKPNIKWNTGEVSIFEQKMILPIGVKEFEEKNQIEIKEIDENNFAEVKLGESTILLYIKDEQIKGLKIDLDSISQSDIDKIIFPNNVSLNNSIDEVKKVDPEVAQAIIDEENRQNSHIELIASENWVSKAVMAAMGSPLTNKYAEGYPGKRYYGGCECVDVIENLAIERAKKLFGCDYANVQPHSGAQANMAVQFAVLKPGDTIMGMNLDHGGHLTHGSPVNMSGKYFHVVPYGVDDNGFLDYDRMRELALECRPKMIIAGASAYARTIDFKKFREVADEVGAVLMVDMAHIAGLVAAGLHPSPIPYADVVTTTTHKTLRGPRGGMILCNKEANEKFNFNKAIFPGIQGGPLMHVIAAKAVCFEEALSDDFKVYQKNIVDNAQALCKGLMSRDIKIVSGGTDNHLMLVDLTPYGLTGKAVEKLLDAAHITANKNTIPNDPQSPFVTSGIRLGTPAVTSRGLNTEDMDQVAEAIAMVIKGGEEQVPAARAIIQKLTDKYPLI